MAKRTIGLGSNANDNTGDTIRAGGTKINANFDDIWSGVFRWVEKNVNYTAVAGDKVLVDSVAAARTITLPASALFGQEITVCDAKGSAGTNNITINRNGHLIQGSANNAVINLNFGVKTYVYESATKGWIENTAAAAGINQLDNVGNVTITSNSAGELLKWNGSAWINNTLVEAGVAALTGSTNNTVVTVTGAHLIQGEGNLTFDGSTLAVTGAATISGATTLSEDVTLTGAAANAVWDKSNNALEFADNAKATFGASADLSIYHDGSHSYITDSGTGSLIIKGTDLYLQDASGNRFAFGTAGGTCELYHNASAKISTSATGATITGTLVATTNTDTSNSGSVTLDFAANQNFVLTLTGNVTLANPSTEQVGQSGIICCIQDGTGSRTLSLGTDYETAGGAGITLSTAANAVDIIPYFVKASGSIQLGAVQLAFS